MFVALYVITAVILAVGSLYLAWRYRDVRKFLAGAFFVSSGILFYLYLADVSVPLLGTSFVHTPRVAAARAGVHFVLFLLCLYYGFIKPAGSESIADRRRARTAVAGTDSSHGAQAMKSGDR